MIEKFRKKMLLLFLLTTMTAFTAAMLLMANNTVRKVQGSEIDYADHMADSIIEQIKNRNGIDQRDLLVYSSKFRCWVMVSHGPTAWHSPEPLATPLDVLMGQIGSGTNSLEALTVGSDPPEGEFTRSVYPVSGRHRDRYYAVRGSFRENGGSSYELLALCPRSSPWDILRDHCGWYPLLWLGILMTMYFLSRFLIQKAISPVQDAMRSQKEFIASASHELKAPLSVIQVNAETLALDGADTASIQKQRLILDECGRMAALIQSLLTLASSDGGQWTMDMGEADVDTLLIEAWEMWNERARGKGIRLHVSLDEEYPRLLCSRERVLQVLGILLDNAISYAPPGSSVEMGAKAGAKQLSFFVTDHGGGIPDEQKGRVFERFYSGDPSRTDQGHYGLGLSIAQEIVGLHRGTILLKDTPGGGCTFEVRIPLKNRPSQSLPLMREVAEGRRERT